MIGKPWKLFGKTLAALLALLIIIVLVFIAINSIDRSPSPAALELQQAWESRKAVDAAENGYIYLAGFDAATDEEPEVVGKKRIQLSNDIVKGLASNDEDLFRAEYKIEDAFIKEVKAVFDQCATVNKNCIEAVEKNKDRISEWSQAENVINERYAQLIAHPQWLELAPVDLSLPIPNFGLVMKAQRIAFIHKFATLAPGDARLFSELLDADLRFWRTVLRDTDMLIAKMVAVAAIKNNFLWTNYFLLSLDENERAAAIPTVIQTAFVDEELSMRRCFTGEWVFSSKTYAETGEMNNNTLLQRLAYRVLFKKQDTINRSAASFQQLIDEQDIPTAEFEAAFIVKKDAKPNRDTQHSAFSFYILNPYNPVGKILLAVAAPVYDGYVARTRDLEAFRRGLLASIEYMKNATNTDIQYTSLYKTKPFVINQEQRSITVNGLGDSNLPQLVYHY